LWGGRSEWRLKRHFALAKHRECGVGLEFGALLRDGCGVGRRYAASEGKQRIRAGLTANSPDRGTLAALGHAVQPRGCPGAPGRHGGGNSSGCCCCWRCLARLRPSALELQSAEADAHMPPARQRLLCVSPATGESACDCVSHFRFRTTKRHTAAENRRNRRAMKR
jgi:hypothetical protein